MMKVDLSVPVLFVDTLHEEVRVPGVVRFPVANGVFLALLLWLRPDFAVGMVVLLQGVVPPITAIPILVGWCRGNRRVASQFVVAGLIFSLLSILAFIYLFNKFFPMPL